jgi:hypothetical protein
MSDDLARRVAALEEAAVTAAIDRCGMRPCGRHAPLGAHFRDMRCPDCPINAVDGMVAAIWQRGAFADTSPRLDLEAAGA